MPDHERPPETVAYADRLTRAARYMHQWRPEEFLEIPVTWRWLEVDRLVSSEGARVTRDAVIALARLWYSDHAADAPPDEVAAHAEAVAVACQEHRDVTHGELAWMLYCVTTRDRALALHRLRLISEAEG